MDGFFEKGVLTTFGAFLFLQEKAGEAVSDMMERGRMAPEEGRRFMEDLTNRLERDTDDMRAKIQDEADLKDLKGRLAKIEGRLEEIASRLEK